MTFSFVHPREDVLADYVRGSLDSDQRERVASHLRACTSCQDTLRFLNRLTAAVATPAPEINSDILSRAMQARAAGERRILPNPDMDASVKRRSMRPFGWVAAVAASLALAVTVLGRPYEVTASSPKSELRISPAKPHLGDSIHVSYKPTAGLFVGQQQLVIRARLRIFDDPQYARGVPVARVRRVAMLQRASNGEFTGTFRLPDSVVFASLVIEDTAAGHVDDNGGRYWEVLTHATGQPTYEALNQRAGDLMGRSWEAAYASAKEGAKLYASRTDAVALLNFFDGALADANDSLVREHGAKFDSLVAAAKSRPGVSSSELGLIFFSRRGRWSRRGATAADTAEFDYWLQRLTREQPRHPQLAQHYAVNLDGNRSLGLEQMSDSLEKLYAYFAPLSGPAQNIVNVGMGTARRSKDDAVYRRWSERLAGMRNRGDSAYNVALGLMRRPSLRREGEAELRRLLASSPEAVAGAREFGEDQKAYLRRAEDARRVAFWELGRSLIADKHIRAGLDTLGIAAQGQWDPQLFRGLATSYADAGDSAEARAMRIRIAVDPRTNPDTSASILAAGKAQLGAMIWDSLVTSARREMYSRMLDRSLYKQVHGSPSVVGEDGKSHTMRELAGGQPIAIILWTRYCGWAVEALPAIKKVTERMAREGKHVVFVVLDPPSAEGRQYLVSKDWKQPVYYDTRGEIVNAFSSFGTPAYFVLDGNGRIRFNDINDRLTGHAELIAQLDALRAERGELTAAAPVSSRIGR